VPEAVDWLLELPGASCDSTFSEGTGAAGEVGAGVGAAMVSFKLAVENCRRVIDEDGLHT